jgi:hypothetical protein
MFRRLIGKRKRHVANNAKDFIYLSAIGEQVVRSPSYYVINFLTKRILPLIMEIDSESITELETDLLDTLTIVSPNSYAASADT